MQHRLQVHRDSSLKMSQRLRFTENNLSNHNLGYNKGLLCPITDRNAFKVKTLDKNLKCNSFAKNLTKSVDGTNFCWSII